MHIRGSGRLVLPMLSAALAAALAGTLAVSAQTPQSLPGIIIAAPPPMPQAGQPPPMMNPMAPPPGLPQAVPPQQPPAAAPKPKPKPRVIARPKEAAPTGDAPGKATGPGSTRIALLVNGEPITGYEIDQRARLLGLQSDIQSRAQETMKRLATSEAVTSRWKQIVQETITANQGKTREQIIAIIQEKQKAYSLGLQKQAVESARSAVVPGLRDKARTELIEEQVKLQDARRNGATPDESMVEDLVKDIAQRNKMTSQQFAQHFAGMGVDISTLKSKFRTQLAWTDTVRRQYSHLAVPNNRDIDRLLQNDSSGEDQLELQLQRIVISVPPKLDQASMAKRLAEAEQLQNQFTNCRSTSVLAGKVNGARFENMGARRVSTFTEPSRTMLLGAPDESMIPPTMTSSGIELLAVCGRRVIKAADEKRNQKANELRQETFERLSRAHLRKLMDNAVIENR